MERDKGKARLIKRFSRGLRDIKFYDFKIQNPSQQRKPDKKDSGGLEQNNLEKDYNEVSLNISVHN